MISVAAVSVAITSGYILRLPLGAVPLAFVYVTACLAYGLDKYVDRSTDEMNMPSRASFIGRHGRSLLAFAIGAYVLGLGVLALARPSLAPVGLLAPLAAWAYSSGLLKRRYLWKNLYVGMLWGLIPIGMALYYGQPSPEAALLAVLVCGFLTTAAAVFDIKDIRGDRAAGIDTLPVLHGVRRTKRFALVALCCSVPVVAIAALALTPRFWILLGYSGYLLAVIPFARESGGPLYYGVVIDGEHVLIGTVCTWLTFF